MGARIPGWHIVSSSHGFHISHDNFCIFWCKHAILKKKHLKKLTPNQYHHATNFHTNEIVHRELLNSHKKSPKDKITFQHKNKPPWERDRNLSRFHTRTLLAAGGAGKIRYFIDILIVLMSNKPFSWTEIVSSTQTISNTETLQNANFAIFWSSIRTIPWAIAQHFPRTNHLFFQTPDLQRHDLNLCRSWNVLTCDTSCK